jgi:hypothetical protein
MKSERKWLAVLLAAVTTIAVALAAPPIPQDPAYHLFADTRQLLGVANFLDVVSNLGFLVVGVAGLRAVLQPEMAFINAAERRCFIVLFCAITATAFGSGYYHLAPDTPRLFWDRLPMTFVAMSFTSAIVAERVQARTGLITLIVLTLVGAASALYWRYSELQGEGDLRFYGLVQFLPLMIVPLVLFLFPSRYSGAGNLVLVVIWYIVAKICEYFDQAIFLLIGVSGHTLKHLFAALALYFILRMLRKRVL